MEPKNIICRLGYTALGHEIKDFLQRADYVEAAPGSCDGKHHLQQRPIPMIKVHFREIKGEGAARRMNHSVHPDVQEPYPVKGHGGAESESDESSDSAGAVTGECGAWLLLAVGRVSCTTPGGDAADAEGKEDPDFDGVELGWGSRKGDVEECDEGRELEA